MASIDEEAGRIAAVKKRMDALRVDFARRLPGRVEELESALARARDTDGGLAEVTRLAHKIHGTAGSYGFTDVAVAAAAIEELSDDEPPHHGELADLARELARAARAALPDAPSQERDVDSPAEPATTLLVVDEDDALLRDVRKMGASSLFDLAVAHTADEALELARTRPIDGALIRAELGGDEGGFALARRLRVAADRDLGVGFFSADDRLGHRIAAVHAGGVVFLREPFSAEQLQDAAHSLAAVGRAERPRVLLVEDDEDFAAQMVTVLSGHGMAVEHLADPQGVLETLARVRPDLLLLDLAMPKVSGLEVCRTLRAMPEWRDLLVLFVSAQPSREARLACFEAGADDYLQKPILEQELLARTRVRLDRARLARERRERDPLTGLFNRRAFAQAFATRLAENRRQGTPLSLALLDVDRFKRINDQRGHLVGDRVLSALGRHLSRSFRPSDLRGRWGGEELVLAFPGEAREVTRAIVERCLAELSEVRFRDDDGDSFGVTFSAGVAVLPEEATRLDEALSVADRRLRAAKESGRARVVDRD